MKIGIVGATGWLGSALGGRLLAGGHVTPDELILLNRSGPRPDYHGISAHWAKNVAELVDHSAVIVVSVRPEDWAGLNLHAPDRLVISFMAGISTARLAESGGRIIRAMPNAAAEIGASYSPFYAAPSVNKADLETARRILSAIGTSDALETEAQIDLMTALPGSGAAYPALMAAVMLDWARAQGLPDAIAQNAVRAVIRGGTELLSTRISEIPQLIDAYHSYRGTTAAGLSAAEAAGFPAAITQALNAASHKAARMTAQFDNKK